jgi:hypothetical protein
VAEEIEDYGSEHPKLRATQSNKGAANRKTKPTAGVEPKAERNELERTKWQTSNEPAEPESGGHGVTHARCPWGEDFERKMKSAALRNH